MSKTKTFGLGISEEDINMDLLEELSTFPLLEALFGRRSRRFFLGAEVPDGPLAYKSKHEPIPLDNLEKLLILLGVSGVTGWHHSITRHDRYKPNLSNYSGSASGRTHPSAAGFHTSEVFFTDDTGTYIFRTRDFAPEVHRDGNGNLSTKELLLSHQKRIEKISDERLHIPNYEPYMEGHNSWIANKPGTFLAFPVGDLAQHTLLNLAFYIQNGLVIYDDINDRKIPGVEKYSHLVDIDDPVPLSFLDQYSLAELSAELATATYSGMLLQQAIGLGGWMFDGIDRLTVLGASGDPNVPGLGFRYDTDERWPMPNPTGLEGVFTSYTPPHFPTMRDAVEALVERKFGEGGPFHSKTKGIWKDTVKVRGSAKVHDEEFIELMTLQADYIYNTFGKFPAIYNHIILIWIIMTNYFNQIHIYRPTQNI